MPLAHAVLPGRLGGDDVAVGVVSLGHLPEHGRELAALVVRDLAAHARPPDALVLEGADHSQGLLVRADDEHGKACCNVDDVQRDEDLAVGV
eukprot:9391175-Heterocapsa_arctica.AAC.1